MTNLEWMERQRRWLSRQGFATAAAQTAKAIETYTQGETK